MFLIGCTPLDRHTEQHDIFFSIGTKPKDFVSEIIDFWPEAKGKLHIDAWREVRFVDGFEVHVEEKNAGTIPTAGEPSSLFFINLGGYKPAEFEEFHYKMVAVAADKGAAIRQAKQTAFYRHTGFAGAESHVDDKFGVDVDDAHEINDILTPSIKNSFHIYLSKANEKSSDEINLGYFMLHKL
jgi:hypothetical protein